MARPKKYPDDPKGPCNFSLRQSIREALGKEGNRSETVEWLVESFLLERNAKARRLVRQSNELKDEFARINKYFHFVLYDIEPKEYEGTTKPEDEGVLRPIKKKKLSEIQEGKATEAREEPPEKEDSNEK